jgi:uncharacterized membrane protein YqjE
MATQVEPQGETHADESVGSLVGGIVQDARKLFIEQLTLFQVEIKNDLHRTLRALAPLLGGVAILLVGLFLLGVGAAYLLCWAFPDLTLWGGFAIVGGVVAAAGAGLIYWAKVMLESVSPLVPDTAMKALRENLQWKTKN